MAFSSWFSWPMTATVLPKTLTEAPERSSIRVRARPRSPMRRERIRQSEAFSCFPVIRLMSITPR